MTTLRAAGARGPLPALLGCAALVLASAAWKSACLDGRRNYRVTCYSDVLELWTSRGLERHDFPYVGGRLVDGAPVDTFEYPVLTGLFIWLSSLPAHDRASFLVASTVLLLPFALLVTAQLQALAGQRVLLWAGAPALVLYALHNWDLLVVSAATAGLVAWRRERPTTAAVLFGIGTCLKLYPALFVLPLAADRLLRGDRTGAVRVCLAAAVTVAVVNAPFVLADPSGWATTWVFQAAREADSSSNSLWYWLGPQLPAEQLDRLVPALVLVALGAALLHGAVRGRREGAYPLVQVCGAALVAFLLVNKVASPQYTLWLLPFLVLLRVHWAWWAAWSVADVMVYVGVFRWFHALVSGADPALPQRVLETGVWARCALLVLLYVVLLRAQPAQRPEVKTRTSTAISGAQTAA